MKKISIIVPVYNLRNYIVRCVESLLCQTYTNIEILLINDGSKDDSAVLCDALLLEDHRIKVVHKANGGLSSARNIGMDIAQGDFLMFVDGDDWIAADMVEILYRCINEYDCDIAECGWYNVHQDILRPETKCTGEIVVATGVDATEGFLDWKNYFPIACNKLYRKTITKNIRYPQGKLHEDEFTTYRFFLASRRVVSIDIPKYYYDRTREDSITNTSYSEKNLDAVEAINLRLHVTWDCNHIQIEKKMNDVYSWVLFSHIQKCFDHKISTKKITYAIRDGLSNWHQMLEEKRPLSPHYSQLYEVLEQSGVSVFVDNWKKIMGF